MDFSELIQVGVMAMRESNGDFKEATPLYMKTTPEMIKREKEIIASIEQVEAKYLFDYIEAQKKAENKKEIYDK